MKGLKLIRTFHEGTRNYVRNGWLTVATVIILTLSLFIVSMTMILGVTTQLILDNLRDKINISVSFNPDVSEDRILSIKQELLKYQEVDSVNYISRDKALEDFLASGSSDPVIAQAIDEIGENPLLASLTIKAKSSDQYEVIAKSLEQSAFSGDINRINYEKNKKAIDRLDVINTTTRKVGLVLGTIFVAISFLITFNTVRINMYSRRSEFEIMRLVGASNTYVRMPSVFEGMFYGLTATVITLILLLVTIQSVAALTNGAVSQEALLDFYKGNFIQIASMLLILGVFLGALSGFVAVKKYLKV